MADLLIEVENDLRFSAHFLRPGEKQDDAGEVCALLAAILAHGCNLGLYTMEKLAPGIPYRKLRHVSDWRLVEENHVRAVWAVTVRTNLPMTPATLCRARNRIHAG